MLFNKNDDSRWEDTRPETWSSQDTPDARLVCPRRALAYATCHRWRALGSVVAGCSGVFPSERAVRSRPRELLHWLLLLANGITLHVLPQ